MTPYRSRRDGRFDHSSEAIDHIEQHNCVKGCAIPDPQDIREFGPGGNCPILVQVAIGDGEPIEQLDDRGRTIVCLARQVKAEEPPVVPSLPLWGDA